MVQRQYSDGTVMVNGWCGDGKYQYSASFTGSRHDAKYNQYSNLANLFYEGCLQTMETTPDGFSPIETSDTKQTRLVVQEPGKSRLKTET